MRNDTFSTYNPIINFTFYIGAIVLGMFFVHPAFLACAFVSSFAYYASLKGVNALKMLPAMVSIFIVISAINPLLNTRGQRVLFMIGERPYTFEALCYGMAIAAMFVVIILWFASYSIVMTSDKFMYIFGRLMPSASLALTMILRLIPSFKNKAMQITDARKTLGKWGNSKKLIEKAGDGAVVISILTGWALEGGIITADSMRSRGYGCGPRSNYSIYRFERRDVLLFAGILFLIGLVVYCALNGAVTASYTPKFNLTGVENPCFIPAVAGYFILLMIPTVLNIVEEIRWRILRLKI